jgi:hypothetical protein
MCWAINSTVNDAFTMIGAVCTWISATRTKYYFGRNVPLTAYFFEEQLVSATLHCVIETIIGAMDVSFGAVFILDGRVLFIVLCFLPIMWIIIIR